MSEHAGHLVLFALLSARYSVGTFFGEVLAPSGLSPSELSLYALVRDGEGLAPQTLSELTGMPATTMSSKLARMGDRGDSARRQNPDDRRSYLITLTAAGRRRFERAIQCLFDAYERLEAEFAVPVDDIRRALEDLDGAARRASGREGPPSTAAREDLLRERLEEIRPRGRASR